MSRRNRTTPRAADATSPHRSGVYKGTVAHRRWAVAALALASILFAGCIQDVLTQTNLFVKGEPFIISGTASLLSENGPCIVWLARNGVTYHLYQGARVANADFDRVTTPGATSRLEIATRNDLSVDCLVGTIVEVQRVLEIIE